MRQLIFRLVVLIEQVAHQRPAHPDEVGLKRVQGILVFDSFLFKNRDINVVRDWGATTWVNLLTSEEMKNLHVNNMPEALQAVENDILYLHLPIEDAGIPDYAFERQWEEAGKAIRADLMDGGKVLIHCKGGLGRTGTIAARLLVELGVQAEMAICLVRTARPGAIENLVQESHVRSIRCIARPTQKEKRSLGRGRDNTAREIPKDDLLRIQELFHGLIRSRAREGGIPIPRNLPKLPATTSCTKEHEEWFAVPGMHGGFAYHLERDGELRLITSSWCRGAEGSGKRHKITKNEIRILEEGFV